MDEEALLQDFADEALELTARFPDADPVPIGPPPTTEIAGMSVSLHRGDPGEDGSQNEVSYAGYARVAVEYRTTGLGQVQNSKAVEFPTCTGGSVVASHICVWRDGRPLVRGSMTAALAISSGLTPRLEPGALRIDFGAML